MMKANPQRMIHRKPSFTRTYTRRAAGVRLYLVAAELSHKYLTPTDLGSRAGAEGSGKSTLIKGLLPAWS
jgi:hypothetical protein